MKKTQHLDAIVIGAGFGGMYMLKKLRDEQGLKVRVFDKAGGVGGTWYWNRYPGALSDTESFVYCYSWDKELLQEMHITTRYVTQPQILSYLEHVADRHNLRPDIQLNTNIRSFNIDAATGTAVVEITARIVGDRTGQIQRARLFAARVPAGAVDGPGATQALDRALSQVLVEIVRWAR